MSKEKDWMVELLDNKIREYLRDNRMISKLAHSIRQELVRRIEGKKESIKGLNSPYKEQKAFDDGYSYALDEVIKEISNES